MRIGVISDTHTPQMGRTPPEDLAAGIAGEQMHARLQRLVDQEIAKLLVLDADRRRHRVDDRLQQVALLGDELRQVTARTRELEQRIASGE